MEDNPYIKLAEGSQSTAWQVLRMGRVAKTAPLTVQASGVLLTGRDIFVNAALLDTGNGKTHGHSLAVGDMVALLTADDQTFIVLCKVVQAP